MAVCAVLLDDLHHLAVGSSVGVAGLQSCWLSRCILTHQTTCPSGYLWMSMLVCMGTGCSSGSTAVSLRWTGCSEILIGLLYVQVMTVFGRLPCNDIVLDHPSSSRQHAALTFKKQQQQQEGVMPVLSDLGSAHGTFINSRRITRVRGKPEIGVYLLHCLSSRTICCH